MRELADQGVEEPTHDQYAAALEDAAAGSPAQFKKEAGARTFSACGPPRRPSLGRVSFAPASIHLSTGR
jgi:hypothetical protein